MKRLFVFAVFVFLRITLLAQPQRMVVLPSNFAKGENLWLCIDAFRAPPDGKYNHLESSGPGPQIALNDDSYIMGGKYYTKSDNGLSTVTDKQFTEPFIVGSTDEPVSPAYQRFINESIKDFGISGNSTWDLQYHIWAYNVLEVLGYIKESEAPQEAFTRAKAIFSRDFDLIKSDEKNIEVEILQKGLQIHAFNKSIAKMALSADNISGVYIRRTTTGSFIAFQEDKMIFSGDNVLELASSIGGSNNQATFISLDGFKSTDQKEGILFTIGNRRPELDVIGTSAEQMYLLQNVWRKNLHISKPLINNPKLYEGYYEQEISFADYSDSEYSFIAKSSKKEVLGRLIPNLNRDLTDRYNQYLFGKYFLNFKRQMLRAGIITNNKEFQLIAKNLGFGMRIVKINPKYIYYAG